MSHRAMYLNLNKQFSSRAALLSLSAEERRLDHALLSFVFSLSTLAHFAEVTASYLGMKALDHMTEEGIGKVQSSLKQFIHDLRGRIIGEGTHPSSDAKESDKLVAEADQTLDPFFNLLPTASPSVLEAALQAGRDGAYAYLRNDLKVPQSDSEFLAKAVETELRAALASTRRSGSSSAMAQVRG